jgi:hypothetical protein
MCVFMKIVLPSPFRRRIRSRISFQAAHRLVQEDDVGIVHDGLGDADSLQHALRVGPQPGPAGVSQADLLQKLCHALGSLLRRNSGDPGVEVQELRPGEKVVEVGVLGKESHVLAELVLADVVAEDGGAPALGVDQTHQDLERGGLPGAIGADEAEDLALADAERDSVQDALSDQTEARPEVLDDVLDLDDVGRRLRHHDDPSVRSAATPFTRQPSRSARSEPEKCGR